jgi:hypothetical protein
VTSKADEIERILFDLHSSMGRHNRDDPRFDVNHLKVIEQTATSEPSDQVGPDFCELAISSEEIDTVLHLLQNNKAIGLDSICNESLKAGGDCLVSALVDFFSFIWAQAVVQSVWHSLTICLIIKENGADPLDA